jgi:hypothetical protein
MKVLTTAILLTVSLEVSAYEYLGSKSASQIQERITQPMYYDKNRLQNERELQELKESNGLAREQLQLEREQIEEERFQRQIDSHE